MSLWAVFCQNWVVNDSNFVITIGWRDHRVLGISGLHASIRPPAFDRSRHMTRHVGLGEPLCGLWFLHQFWLMGIQCHHLLPTIFAVSIYCDLYIAPNFRPHITYGSLFDPQKKKKGFVPPKLIHFMFYRCHVFVFFILHLLY